MPTPHSRSAAIKGGTTTDLDSRLGPVRSIDGLGSLWRNRIHTARKRSVLPRGLTRRSESVSYGISSMDGSNTNRTSPVEVDARDACCQAGEGDVVTGAWTGLPDQMHVLVHNG